MRFLTTLLLTAFLMPAETAAPVATPKSFIVEVKGNPKGKPVILIPGLSSSSAVWDKTVAHLAPKYQCHLLTLAGFAGVPRMSDGPLLPTVRQELDAYIRAQKLDHPMVIGHSLGGHMALWVASESPDLVGPLLIVDSLPHLGAMMGLEGPNMLKQAEGMRMMITSQTKEQYGAYIKNSGMLKSIVGDAGLPQVTEWSLQSDPVAIGNAMYDLYTTDLRASIAKIKSKVHILGSWIAYKEMSSREQVQKTFEDQYEKLPQKKIVLSDAAKHFLMLDDPAWFELQLDTFLK